MNIVFDSHLDRSAQRQGQSGALSADGQQWLHNLGLVDIWRHFHPCTTDYTFYSHKTYARLNYFLGSQSLLSLAQDSSIEPRALSDHAAITISLSFPPTPRPSYSWRLRETLLHHPEVIARLTKTLEDFLSVNDTQDTSIVSLWETLKLVARGGFIAISSADNKMSREKREELSKQVLELEGTHK